MLRLLTNRLTASQKFDAALAPINLASAQEVSVPNRFDSNCSSNYEFGSEHDYILVRHSNTHCRQYVWGRLRLVAIISAPASGAESGPQRTLVYRRFFRRTRLLRNRDPRRPRSRRTLDVPTSLLCRRSSSFPWRTPRGLL